jgi:hypothetical protein
MALSAQTISDLAVVGGFNSSGIQVAVVGSTVSCVPQIQVAPGYTLTRKPATSSASMSAGSFTADVPGLYQISVVNAGNTIALNLIAAPAAMFAITVGSGTGTNAPAKNPNPYGISPLAAILTYSIGQWTAATFLATVEAQPSAVGYPFGFSGALLGGAATSVLPWTVWGPSHT